MRPAAIVTGGSSGIGHATALRLAKDGFDVGITFHRGEERAVAVAREIERLGVRAAIARQDRSPRMRFGLWIISSPSSGGSMLSWAKRGSITGALF